MSYVHSIKGTIYAILIPPAFFFLFWYLYTPFQGGDTAPLGADWSEHAIFCLAIMSAIILVVSAVSRLLLFFYHRHAEPITRSRYLVWQVAEFLACVIFVDLFVSLFFHATYAYYLPTVALYGALTMLFPYLGFWLVACNAEKAERLDALEQRQVKEEMPMRFVDEKGVTRLVLPAPKVISIESAANYVDILYDNNGVASRYSLRTTLKAIEPLCVQHGLVRCHRSFLLNLQKVKVMRKTPDGLMAEIDFPGVEDIPVSKSYAGEVMKRFNA